MEILENQLFNYTLSLEGRLAEHKIMVLDEIRKVVRVDSLLDKNFISKYLISTVNLQDSTQRVFSKTVNVESKIFDGHPVVRRLRKGNFIKRLARITIPFTGDPIILNHCPDECYYSNLPFGIVIGDKIESDFLISDKNFEQNMGKNKKLIEWVLEKGNKQVRDYNQNHLIPMIKTEVEKSTLECDYCHAVFQQQGIKETKEEVQDDVIEKKATESKNHHNTISIHFNKYSQI